MKRIITGLQAKHHQNEQKKFQVLFIVFARSLLTILFFLSCVALLKDRDRVKKDCFFNTVTTYCRRWDGLLFMCMCLPGLFPVSLFSPLCFKFNDRKNIFILTWFFELHGGGLILLRFDFLSRFTIKKNIFYSFLLNENVGKVLRNQMMNKIKCFAPFRLTFQY